MEDIMNNIPFWEESYKNNEISAFGVKPNAEVEEYLNYFNRNGNVLEVGCCEAKNAFYLIDNGFTNITAFDISEHAISKVHRIAEKKNVKINAFVQDLCNYDWKECYDLIISYGTLHFVKNYHAINKIVAQKNNIDLLKPISAASYI
jgi:tellurite methyltransferase